MMRFFLACTGIAALSFGCFGHPPVPKDVAGNSAPAKEFVKDELVISARINRFAGPADPLSNRAELANFLLRSGPSARGYVYADRGTVAGTVVRIPLIPGDGAGNHLKLSDLYQPLHRSALFLTDGDIAELTHQLLQRESGALGIDPAQVGQFQVERVSQSLYRLNAPQLVEGIPVRGGRLTVEISHGNVVLLGISMAPVRISLVPHVSPAEVVNNARRRLGQGAQVSRKPRLEIAPVRNATAAAIDHQLVYVFVVTRPGDVGTYEVIANAIDGDLLAVQDTARYAPFEEGPPRRPMTRRSARISRGVPGPG
jgi:hypothetical protein